MRNFKVKCHYFVLILFKMNYLNGADCLRIVPDDTISSVTKKVMAVIKRSALDCNIFFTGIYRPFCTSKNWLKYISGQVILFQRQHLADRMLLFALATAVFCDNQVHVAL